MKEIGGEAEYAPKTSLLVSGETVVFTLLRRSDEAAMRAFFSQVPENEAETLRDDVHDPETISRWILNLDYREVLPLVAWNETLERVAGVASLHFQRGVHRHIADIRIVVGKDFRKMGLGSAMIKELIEIGDQLGINYLRAEIPTDNQLAIRAFRQLGFEVKCTLEGYFMSRKNQVRDVMLMFKRLRVSMEEDFFYLY
jgi:L-amino acid N-acyltransferase YncA